MTPLDRAHKYVANMPPAIAGSGGHSATFTVATVLVHGFSLSQSDAMIVLASFNRRCDPPWSEKELAHKIEQAATKPHDKPRGWLLEESDRPKMVIRRATPAEDHIPDAKKMVATPESTRSFLESVFLPTDVVCIVQTSICEAGKHRPDHGGSFLTRVDWSTKYFAGEAHTSMFRDLDGGAWVRINPMKADGDGSDQSVTSFRHVLVEGDEIPKSEQERILRESGLPIAALIDSGGKSIHAWVKVDATDYAQWKERRDVVYAALEELRPCAQNKNPSRLSRLPGVNRGESTQALLGLSLGAKTWDDWKDFHELGEIPEPISWKSLMDFDRKNDPNNLVGDRFLCRGGSLIISGESGIGKSSALMQLALLWATGRDFFGIDPHKPRRIGVIQAENDLGDLAEEFQDIVAGANLNATDCGCVQSNLFFWREVIKTGPQFIAHCRRLIKRHKLDFLIADPMFAFCGGDLADNAFLSGFLRNQLNPVIEETGVCWVWLHHTGKPKVGSGNALSDSKYSAYGGSEIINWARATIALSSTEQAGQFVLTIHKRGMRAGLKDEFGIRSTAIPIQHATDRIFWERGHKVESSEKPKSSGKFKMSGGKLRSVK